MKTIVLKNSRVGDFKSKGSKVISLVFKDLSIHLEQSIRIGTDILVKTDNTKPEPHRGQYYLLYMQEFGSVYLIYIDTSGVMRIVYQGDMLNAVEALYRFVSDETVVKILKSSNKRAYRVINNTDSVDDELVVVDFKYKNKSSQINSQVYLSLFEAINHAVYLHKKNKHKSFSVITPKGTTLFKVG